MTKTIHAQVAIIQYRQVEFTIEGALPSQQELRRRASEQAEQEYDGADEYIVKDLEYGFALDVNETSYALPS